MEDKAGMAVLACRVTLGRLGGVLIKSISNNKMLSKREGAIGQGELTAWADGA